MTTYQQFKNFFLHADRKVFYILTYQHMVGAGLGLLLGRWAGAHFPAVPGPLCLLLGIVLGLAATWPHEGRVRYRLVLMWLAFQGRRLLGERATAVHTASYFQLPPVQGMVDAPGLLTYHSGGMGPLGSSPLPGGGAGPPLAAVPVSWAEWFGEAPPPLVPVEVAARQDAPHAA